ncbi:PREDICTED: transcription termination factor MTERF15, mitochondrial [Tarenaya hassleriana]|uniref:transcription termination factor MTERF15, mitochondrial n=1 Tax=Tarenaya hassleriana TaxID=28532 RepID=UPI00053C53A9|nr:PREDICTED: transcription termination factor MTERF15, mitochondrial [Tarenaya hassleriana]XP_010537403.1 PREDICTED: transcription termination factor MTERF15, mitochondrial [Tarenaya hassleriana]XP_010537404.1 PREDICTED: transcription termination factor MTERF15, mitochondrial [Tarenaya hassleriana]XP_010537406.1 PREDICTED: transcription termination factor MTERF15, mitochondrial [Tarenaya hassleriana]XP_019057883.1 PREDICTED: transcription termination factor MTERF15, mitochondrial [Tarenaya has
MGLTTRILRFSGFNGFKVTIMKQNRPFSARPSSQTLVSVNQSHYRKRVLLTNLLQRYGFTPSSLQNLLSRNNALLSSDLAKIESSLGILIALKIPHKSLISLVCDCPGVLRSEFLSKWQVPLLECGESVASPSVVRNILEHSSRFGVGPYRFSECLRILRGVGFCDSTISRILGLFPAILMVKELEIHRKIDFLGGIGIPRNSIERFLYVFPEILGLSIENRLKPLLDEFLKMGFSVDDIRREIEREPRVLRLELGELSRCLELLRTLKCREVIRERIFSEGVFRAGFEVKLRVDCLCKYGLIRRDAFKVLWKEPRAILYEIEDIEKKIEFLTNTMGFSISCLAEVPEYLGVNLQKHIIPRHNVIDYLRLKGGLGCDIGLKGLIKPSMNRFYNLYVKPYPECERIFGRRQENAHVQKRHPAGLWKLFKPPSHPPTKEDVKNMKSFVESLI